MATLNARSLAAMVVVVAILSAGCGPHDNDGSSSEGPLTSDLKGGGSSLDPPQRPGRWVGSWGSLTLCSTTGEPVTITSVDYHTPVTPLATRALIRQAPETSLRTGSDLDWGPLISHQGTISGLVKDKEIRSTSLEPAAGAVFDTECRTATKYAYTELLTSMTVDAKGGWIDRITINYTSGGQAYALSVDYSYSACGTAVAHEWFCDPDWNGGSTED